MSRRITPAALWTHESRPVKPASLVTEAYIMSDRVEKTLSQAIGRSVIKPYVWYID